jgi:hypothetical protein
MGWCAQDRRRLPLTGLELRGCWAERPSTSAAMDATAPRAIAVPDPIWPSRARDFVPVGAVAPSTTSAPEPAAVPLPAIDAPEPWETRVSLFGDLDR